ncbi:hypothetical protein [Nocardia sp. NPDC052316]|uniref:hypothetical protein n=1 Tax=Nocardia sp. NPDC052316 TaxID=3364329 RepID=UPI0037C78949
MTAADQVTGFVAHYQLDNGDNWEQKRNNWRQSALDAWLEAARQHGLDVTVQEMCEDPDREVAVVEVEGQEYYLTHFSRRPEVKAKLR